MLWHLCDDDVDDDEEIFIEYYMSFEWRFYDNFTYVISFFVFYPLTHSAYDFSLFFSVFQAKKKESRLRKKNLKRRPRKLFSV